jgi:hypothetical protein
MLDQKCSLRLRRSPYLSLAKKQSEYSSRNKTPLDSFRQEILSQFIMHTKKVILCIAVRVSLTGIPDTKIQNKSKQESPLSLAHIFVARG